MRVLLTADAVGGVWTYAATLARGLAERGDRCFVAVVGEPSAAQLSALPPSAEVESATWALEWLPSASEGDVRGATAWLKDLARRWGADVVHLNQFAYGAEPLGAPVVLVAHSDVFSWFREVRDTEPGRGWASYREWVRAGLRTADVVVAPTCYQSGMLARHYGRAADRVIPNGSAPPGEPAQPPSGRASLMTAGRAWDEAKGMDTLDRALELLGERAPPTHLAGSLEGPAGERFEGTRLLPRGTLGRAEMDALYRDAAIYVAMSLYEPFGLAPLEAAGHGCALVLSDIGSFRELWQDAALFVPPGAPEPLADALESLIAEPERMDELAAAARSRAVERYTEARMVDAYRALYGRMTMRRSA